MKTLIFLTINWVLIFIAPIWTPLIFWLLLLKNGEKDGIINGKINLFNEIAESFKQEFR